MLTDSNNYNYNIIAIIFLDTFANMVQALGTATMKDKKIGFLMPKYYFRDIH